MKINYLIILAIMAVACYFLFIRKPKARPGEDNLDNVSGPDENA